MAEMKSLNGHEIVDAKARERLDDLENNGGAGGGVVTVTVDSTSGTASHNAAAIYELVQAGNAVVALMDGVHYQYVGAAHFADDGVCDTVTFYRTNVGDNGTVSSVYISIYDDSTADTTNNEAAAAYISESDNETIPDVETPSADGSTSIDVTAEVGQTIIVKEVDENGKPTKWESSDYQPRTHWSEVAVVFEGSAEVDLNGEMFFGTTTSFKIIDGETYTVNWNGVEYTCVGKTADYLYIGNYSAFDGEDTGEPFVIIDLAGIILGLPLDDITSATLSIIGEKITPIPAEYLTNALPYYVEITLDGATYRTAETPENLLEQHNCGRSIFAKITTGSVITFVPLSFFNIDTYRAVFSTRMAADHSSGDIVFADIAFELTETDGAYSVALTAV